MAIHRTYPDANGNPDLTMCGKKLDSGARWMKTHPPDCPDCNSRFARQDSPTTTSRRRGT